VEYKISGLEDKVDITDFSIETVRARRARDH
jgi:hypothetical protein